MVLASLRSNRRDLTQTSRASINAGRLFIGNALKKAALLQGQILVYRIFPETATGIVGFHTLQNHV
jgi:hypothetical protein